MSLKATSHNQVEKRKPKSAITSEAEITVNMVLQVKIVNFSIQKSVSGTKRVEMEKLDALEVKIVSFFTKKFAEV